MLIEKKIDTQKNLEKNNIESKSAWTKPKLTKIRMDETLASMGSLNDGGTPTV
ncbi:hypothetical protein [Thalassospira lucentensis]|uniref:hypothetical protein n=1 Tax=Thalassospira lucentensis TaxID=168935 RepID=UPI00142D7A86|nr:hypothetical protein [Thalassospira lucentensis]NIZ01956.1 hypothetical protein [Thalassospira lucentensis]